MLQLTLFLVTVLPTANGTAGEKPLFREFMGVNGHTIQFKPKLYAPAVRAVRDPRSVHFRKRSELEIRLA